MDQIKEILVKFFNELTEHDFFIKDNNKVIDSFLEHHAQFTQPGKGVEEAAKEYADRIKPDGSIIDSVRYNTRIEGFIAGASFNQALCDRYREAFEKIKTISDNNYNDSGIKMTRINKLASDALKQE